MQFQPFGKIPRLSRECVITEKLDGTNASISIFFVSYPENPFDMDEDCFMVENPDGHGFYAIAAGSRSRFITPGKSKDNFGFAGWVRDHATELAVLGEGTHYGEWWGKGIQRNYGLDEKRFSLFNTGRWDEDSVPACCHVVPELWRGPFDAVDYKGKSGVGEAMDVLKNLGSAAASGFMNPEGIIIYHTAANSYFKKTIEGDEKPKSA